MASSIAKKQEKVECTNPNTGRRMLIDAETWNLFTGAIQDSLKGGKQLTFTEIVAGIKDYLKKKKINFKQSVDWYAVTVKHDMQVRKMIKVYDEKGKKLHTLNVK